MVKTLEQRLQTEVGATMARLLPATKALPPKPSVALIPDENPHYWDGVLYIPKWIIEDPTVDKVYKIGKAACLPLLYHGNVHLQHMFRDIEMPEYRFWSQLSMTYAGLLSLLYQQDKHAANRKAEICRRHVKEIKPVYLHSSVDEFAEYAAFVGIDYAAQLYQKHGDKKFADVLGIHNVFEVHDLVVVNESFTSFIAKDW